MPTRTTTAEPEPTPEQRLAEARERLARPFDAEQIEKLPKQLRKDDNDKGRCGQGGYSADGYVCGGWHARSMHLDYVGHAGVTMRLLEVDPEWTWEPLAYGPDGLPLVQGGGLWIKLTVLGVTRLGYGDAPGKREATKELIGDAIRNAALRFGVATYLWSKSEAAQIIKAGGDPDAADPEPPRRAPEGEPDRPQMPADRLEEAARAYRGSTSAQRQAPPDAPPRQQQGKAWRSGTEWFTTKLGPPGTNVPMKRDLAAHAKAEGWEDDPRDWDNATLVLAGMWWDARVREADEAAGVDPTTGVAPEGYQDPLGSLSEPYER